MKNTVISESTLDIPVIRVLHLTLKKKWFDMIASGEKRDEYREIKPHWDKRLNGREYDVVKFRNGYRTDSKAMTVELLNIVTGIGSAQWGAPERQEVYILRLGKILTPHNE